MKVYRVQVGHQLAIFTSEVLARRFFVEQRRKGVSPQMMDPVEFPLNKEGVLKAYAEGLGDRKWEPVCEDFVSAGDSPDYCVTCGVHFMQHKGGEKRWE